MPKTDPPLLKSKRVVVSLSPAEYERWERIAAQQELRVPEFVRFVNHSSHPQRRERDRIRMPYISAPTLSLPP